MVVRLPGGREAEPVVGARIAHRLAEGGGARGAQQPAAGGPRQRVERGALRGVRLRGVDRIDRVAELVGGPHQRTVEAGRHGERPGARQQEHHPAAGRRLETAQGRDGGLRALAETGAGLRADPPGHPIEFLSDLADLGASHAVGVAARDAVRVVLDPSDVGLQLALAREHLIAPGRALPGLRKSGLKCLFIARPAGQHVDAGAVEGEDRHAVRGPEQGEIALHFLQHAVAAAGEGERFVDVHQIIPRHLLARGDGSVLGFHRGPVRDLREVFDRHLLAVHQQPEIPGRQAPHALARGIGDHRLDVDHPDVDRLADDRDLGLGRLSQ